MAGVQTDGPPQLINRKGLEATFPVSVLLYSFGCGYQGCDSLVNG